MGPRRRGRPESRCHITAASRHLQRRRCGARRQGDLDEHVPARDQRRIGRQGANGERSCPHVLRGDAGSHNGSEKREHGKRGFHGHPQELVREAF
jgi:hypothetical protein